MYLSSLMINVGDNPDRPDWNHSRNWLRNLYRVHQRLCMAFPTDDRKKDDAPFLKPYRVVDFPRTANANAAVGAQIASARDVHTERAESQGFLFRIDNPPDESRGGRRPVIIVQSANRPDWDYAFGLKPGLRDQFGRPIGNAAQLLAAPVRLKEFDYMAGDTSSFCVRDADSEGVYHNGCVLRLRLQANPTKRAFNGPQKGQRIRVGPDRADLLAWLERKGNDAGFKPIFTPPSQPSSSEDDGWMLRTSWVSGWKTKYEPAPHDRLSFWSVLFEGQVRMLDAERFVGALKTGIGSAKGFGFGLLSIAQCG